MIQQGSTNPVRQVAAGYNILYFGSKYIVGSPGWNLLHITLQGPSILRTRDIPSSLMFQYACFDVNFAAQKRGWGGGA